MTDKNDLISLRCKLSYLPMDFVDERAGRIDHRGELFLFCLLPYLRGNSVRAEDNSGARGHFVNGLDEMHAASDKVPNNMPIMDNLMKYIDGRTMFLKSSLHRCQSHFHTGAESPRLSKNNLFDCHDDFQSVCFSYGCHHVLAPFRRLQTIIGVGSKVSR